MNNFAKIEDVEKLWRSLTEDEKERAKNLLPIVEDKPIRWGKTLIV